MSAGGPRRLQAAPSSLATRPAHVAVAEQAEDQALDRLILASDALGDPGLQVQDRRMGR
jgi:hypothetical protein